MTVQTFLTGIVKNARRVKEYRLGMDGRNGQCDCIGLIIGGACCFLPFPGAPVWAKFIIFIAGYVVWDAFYTVANVPYGSLHSVITDDPQQRVTLSTFRSIGAALPAIIVMVALPGIVYSKHTNAAGEEVQVLKGETLLPVAIVLSFPISLIKLLIWSF